MPLFTVGLSLLSALLSTWPRIALTLAKEQKRLESMAEAKRIEEEYQNGLKEKQVKN